MNKHKPQSVFPQGLFKEESKDHQPTYLFFAPPLVCVVCLCYY